MKVRSLKLREAHKATSNNGRQSFCSVLWDQQAYHVVTASSRRPHNRHPRLSSPLQSSEAPPAPPRRRYCHRSQPQLHLPRLWVRRPLRGEFQTNITRFTLPIRALAFNKSGTLLAAAGDDEGIKLINTVDGSISRVLKGHKGSVTGLAFDPHSEYLASIDSTGTVIYWELQSGTTLHTLKGIAPNSGFDRSIMNVLSWSPDGNKLAVPGLRNDVVVYDRDTAEKLFSLRGDHTQPICFLAWSPNGKYMATSGLDMQVLIWDVDQKQDIDRHKFDERICCLAWKPIGNALAVIDCTGKYGVWESVTPSSMKSPTEDVPNQKLNNSNGLLLFDEEEGEELSTSGSLSDLGEDSHGESEPPSRKRLHKHSAYDNDLEEDGFDDLSLLPKVESHKKARRKHSESADNGKEGASSKLTSVRPKMQVGFQPGATPLQPGKRRFLCYNMLGAITTIEHDGYSILSVSWIQIDFHDTSRGPRVPSMNDHFGFTMASLNENGSVFANPSKGEKNMSTLMYRPFRSWANNSEWSMRLEGEEVKVVALGTAWVAAITSLNFLRIFTDGGLQRHVLSLDGPVVTASGFMDELAIVTHASECLPSNEQMLEYRVLNITNGSQPLRGRLPLTPGSHLTWFGFSEGGKLSSYDSKGVLRVFTSQYGGSWLPLFSASKEKSDENYWVVGLNASKLFCIVCKSPDLYPQVIPKPVLTPLNFSFPLASSDLGADALENEFMLNNMHLVQVQKQIEEVAGAGLDTTSLDDEAFNTEAAQDRCILKLIASCCSVRGAIKLVTVLKLPNLAERFNNILEERLLNESKRALETTFPNSNCNASSITNDIAPSKTIFSTEQSKLPGNDIPLSSPKLSAPIFTKKAKTQEFKVGIEKTEEKQAAMAADLGKVKNDRGEKWCKVEQCRRHEEGRGNVSGTITCPIK
ncbi:WD repeat and HMG-box DNA-binding protein 1 [Prunus yedoensis var. nudiflora]|uniref:WD repeat and HMG-box DNA-binding protein 1 n=1 Tax=Prunus yedoensis var. nudiflora TaxID=2094558 RepID=A0A314UNF0_PRUYE|nr:WD repeat and HMG-box DNA-binding protein 1 [Prunus yedoensis var. nudiflora]